MKRVGFIVALAAVVTLAGCGSTSVVSSPSGQSAPPTTLPKAHVGASLTLNLSGPGGQKAQESVTVTQVIDPAQGADQYTTPDAGKRFVGVKLTIAEVSGPSGQGDANSDVTVVGSDNQTYNADFNSIAGCTNFDNGSFTLSTGQSATGCVTFQVPSGVQVAQVNYKPGAGFDNVVGEWSVP